MTADLDHSEEVEAAQAIRQALKALSPQRRLRLLGALVMEAASDMQPAAVEDAVSAPLQPAAPNGARLTRRQQAIYAWIVAFVQRNGFPPTLREIGAAFGIASTNGVNDHLVALERKGVLERGKHAHRGTKLTRSLRVVERVQ